MLNPAQFSNLSLQQKTSFLRSFLEEVDPNNNQPLLMFKSLLNTIPQPSSQLVNYIFSEIERQLASDNPKTFETTGSETEKLWDIINLTQETKQNLSSELSKYLIKNQ